MPTLPSKTKQKVNKPTPTPRSVDRVHRFVEAYLSNGNNATRAAVAAGLSAKTATSTGGRMLRSVRVRTLLDVRRADLAKKYELTTENVMRSMAQALHFDPRKLYNEDGSLKRVIDLDDDTAMALQAVEVTEQMASEISGAGEVVPVQVLTKKVKWLDKNTARDQAAKVLGLFKEKIEIGATDDFVKVMLSARARAANR
jgi:phage terminase small subunit